MGNSVRPATLFAALTLAFLLSASAAAAAAVSPPSKGKTSPYRSVKLTGKAQNYYMAVWGIDKLKVSYTASGNLIRFSYRVANPTLAKPLSDERATPYMLGQRSHAVLQVPTMDKVGTLRQTGAAHERQEYWMVFSNKGDLIKSGDRVNVVIGAFHADGLMVE
jgi:hypothetical protein